MANRCLACHVYKFNEPGEENLLFCSITCACMAGYMSVRLGFVPKYTMEELANSQKLRDELLNNPPVRVRDRYPCKCHHTKEEREEVMRNAFR